MNMQNHSRLAQAFSTSMLLAALTAPQAAQGQSVSVGSNLGYLDVLRVASDFSSIAPVTNPVPNSLNLGADHLRVGQNSRGSIDINSGGVVINALGYIGTFATAEGYANLRAGGQWINTSDLSVGYFGDGWLNMYGGTVTSQTGYLGYHPGSDGSAGIDAGTWQNFQNLSVGRQGMGTLSIAGGTVINNSSAIGEFVGSSGSVFVDSGNWNHRENSNLSIGYRSAGNLFLNGGTVTSDFTQIGREAGSNGYARLQSGGLWENARNLFVGGSGTGTLDINGGSLSNGASSAIGFNAGSMGSVKMTGGSWSNGNKFSVGDSGSGFLELQGGTLSNSIGDIGFKAGSSGVATVTGGTWINGGTLFVGEAGTGTLNLSAGIVEAKGLKIHPTNGTLNWTGGTIRIKSGTTSGLHNDGALGLSVGFLAGQNSRLELLVGSSNSNTTARIGRNIGSVGSVLVDHSGWVITDSLNVGHGGTGTLDIEVGNVTVSTDSSVGHFAQGTGTVNVNGGLWDSTGDLTVARQGNGTVIITDGTVSNTNGYIGEDAGAVGSVTLNGPTASWTQTGELRVGDAGNGSLTINAGTVSNGLGTIGNEAGSTGTATVTGPNSTWNNNVGSLVVGGNGSGTLLVQQGGTVTSPAANIGLFAGSTGIATVKDANSSWTVTNNLVVGQIGSGDGTLVIEDGGAVSNFNGFLGYATGTMGTGIVVGNGSTWSGNLLQVGRAGDGTLLVADGGAVSYATGTIGDFSGSTGVATVTGPGTTWTSTSDLTIGLAGNGTLNIEDGGSVHVGGSLFMQSSGGDAALNFTLASLADPFLDVTGNATLAGTLGVDLEAGFTLTPGDAFTLIDIIGTQSGVFENYAEADLLGNFNGIDLFLTYTGGNGNDVVAYSIALPSLPGDTDGDGDIDDSDLGTSFSNYTGPLAPGTGGKTAAQGDTDADGDVDDSDLGTSFSGYTGPIAINVPEPTGLLLIGLGSIVLTRRRCGQ